MATTTATSATSSIFFNSHTKTQSQSKPISLISFSSSNFFQKNKKSLNFHRMDLLPSRLEIRKHLKVSAKKKSLSSDEEIQPLVSDGGAAIVHQDEVFSV